MVGDERRTGDIPGTIGGLGAIWATALVSTCRVWISAWFVDGTDGVCEASTACVSLDHRMAKVVPSSSGHAPALLSDSFMGVGGPGKHLILGTEFVSGSLDVALLTVTYGEIDFWSVSATPGAWCVRLNSEIFGFDTTYASILDTAVGWV